MTDAKAIRDEIMQAFDAFKNANDKRLAEIEKTGTASALTKSEVDKANADISALQNRLEEVENRAARPGATANVNRPSDALMQVYANWQGAVQGKDVDPGDVDLDLVRNYNKSFRDWMRRGERASGDSLRLLNEMSSDSAPDGGLWVSPDTSGRIVTLVYETSPVRQLASAQEISVDALEGETDLDEAGANWVGERETRSGNSDTPEVGIWSIPVHEQYAEPRATQKLLDDARVNVEEWLAGKVSRKFARNENTAFVTGNGVKKPRGFMTYDAGTPAGGGAASAWQVIEQIVSGHATTLLSDGLIDLVFGLKSYYRDGAVFGMNRATEREVRQLKDGQNNYLWQPDFTKRAQATLLGYPVHEMPDLADIAASALPIVFGNLKEAYQIVDRGGIRVLRDPYTVKGKVLFYTTKRVGGGVVNFEAIKVHKISA
jgi:HK97 family phage major capsid protein